MSETRSKSSVSSVSTRKSVEQLQSIDMIGKTQHQIIGAKLPSNRQVLQVFFYNLRFVDRNQQSDAKAKNSAKLSIDAVKIYWQQARIPIKEDHRCREKLLKLYADWNNIRKTTEDKRSQKQKQFAESFVDSLDDLFDIASPNALNEIKIPEDKKFLEMQRQKGRQGCMIGVDMSLYGREKRAQERKEKEDARKKKHEEQQKSNTSHFVCIEIK